MKELEDILAETLHELRRSVQREPNSTVTTEWAIQKVSELLKQEYNKGYIAYQAENLDGTITMSRGLHKQLLEQEYQRGQIEAIKNLNQGSDDMMWIEMDDHELRKVLAELDKQGH